MDVAPVVGQFTMRSMAAVALQPTTLVITGGAAHNTAQHNTRRKVDQTPNKKRERANTCSVTISDERGGQRGLSIGRDDHRALEAGAGRQHTGDASVVLKHKRIGAVLTVDTH